MFIVENGKITNSKTKDIGKYYTNDFIFKFQDVEFEDSDVFELTIGTVTSSNYGFDDQGYISFARVDLTSIIDSSSKSYDISITKNGATILDDSITITAVYSGGGVTQEYVQSAISTATTGLASESYVNTAVGGVNVKYSYGNNVSGVDYTQLPNVQSYLKDNSMLSSDTVTVAYSPIKDVYQVDYDGTGAITLQVDSSIDDYAGDIKTFELWITSTVAISTVSIPVSGYTLVGDIGTLQANKTHVFVLRAVTRSNTTNILVNYSFSF